MALMDLKKIQALPSGARFYRCAFQVNTFDYVTRHKHPTPFTDEASYNAALIESCKSHGVEIIGLADHYRIKSAAAARFIAGSDLPIPAPAARAA